MYSQYSYDKRKGVGLCPARGRGAPSQISQNKNPSGYKIKLIVKKTKCQVGELTHLALSSTRESSSSVQFIEEKLNASTVNC